MTLPKTFNTISEEFFQFDTMSASPNFNENQIPQEENLPRRDISTQRSISLNDHQGQFFPNLNLNQDPLTPPIQASNHNSHYCINTNASISSISTSSHRSASLTSTSTNFSQHLNEDSIIAAAAAAASASTLSFPKDSNTERIMPGIYLSQNFLIWNEENLKNFGFTHIIIIDKHIQELYYPSPIFQICAQSETNISQDPYEDSTIYENYSSKREALNFGKSFEAIDLNFGEKSYLQTVLPNCYRAVRFIKKAFQGNGKILVIDCNGGEQKCITIVVAYLMYKYNICFRAAFSRLKEHYKKADLDRFYTRQLYEYEPILQVQKAQSRGHSCSRELQAAILKRKKNIEEDHFYNNVAVGGGGGGGVEDENICLQFNNQSIINENINCDFLKNFDFKDDMMKQKQCPFIKKDFSSGHQHDNHHHHHHNDLSIEDNEESKRLFEEFSCFPPLNEFSFFHDNVNDHILKQHNDHHHNNSDSKKSQFSNIYFKQTTNNHSVNIMGNGMNDSELLIKKWFNKKRLKDNYDGDDDDDDNNLNSVKCYQKNNQGNPKEMTKNLINFVNDCEMC